MELKESHKYQKGYYNVIQIYGGSQMPIYLVIEQSKVFPPYRNFIKSFTRKDEAINHADSLSKERETLYENLNWKDLYCEGLEVGMKIGKQLEKKEK